MKKIPFAMVGTSAAVPDIIYATRFEAPDPVAAYRRPNGSAVLLVGSMEYGRALKQARGCEVHCAASLGIRAKRLGPAGLLAAALRKEGYAEATVAPEFPHGAATELERAGVRVTLARESPYAAARATKTAEEIRAIRAAQSAARTAERALGAAIRRCDIGRRGELVLDGAVFTSERARALVRATLLMRGTMDFEGSIVACGAQAANPHEQGHGPLRAGELIVADIFPRSLRTGYWGDMTRTFHRGRLTSQRRKLLDTVSAAQKLGLSLVKPGVTGKSVHEAVAEFFERAGYVEERGADGTPRGFFHGLGHGVGLEIHEEPRLSPSGTEVLQPGMVVTVEPGLYYPEIGGARIEDTVLVTETGCEIL